MGTEEQRGPCSYPSTGEDGVRRVRVWCCCPQSQHPAPARPTLSLTAAAPPANGCRSLRWAHFPPAEAARPGTSLPFSLCLVPCWHRVRPRDRGAGRGTDQNPGEQPLDAHPPTRRRIRPRSRASLPQSCGARCGTVWLRCFAWAATGQRWRETPRGQSAPRQSQTGTSCPLKVGAVG